MPRPKIGWADASKRAGSGKRYTNEPQASKTPAKTEPDTTDTVLDYNANLQPLSRLIPTQPSNFAVAKSQPRAFGTGAYDYSQFTYPVQIHGHNYQNTASYGATNQPQQPYPYVDSNYPYGGSVNSFAVQGGVQQPQTSQHFLSAYTFTSPSVTAVQSNMSYNYNNSQYGYPQQGYPNPYAQQQQQSYQQTPPQIRNPFAPPAQAQNAYGAQNAGFDPEQEALMVQWQQNYAPPELAGKKDARGKTDNPNTTQLGSRNPAAAPGPAEAAEPAEGDKQMTVVRKGGGQTWEDKSLLEWDPTQFRIMVGNLAGEVTDDSLAKAFAQYGVSKARVVRDKRTTKSKGFGFVAFTDGEQGFKAAREMSGKYIGSHPVTIARAKTDVKPVVHKDKYHKGKNSKNNNKNRDKKDKKEEEDSLRANTGAHIEKKPVKSAIAYKIIG